MWYQKTTQADEPDFEIVGLTNPAVSFGLRGYDVSIYIYQPFPKSRFKKENISNNQNNAADRRYVLVNLTGQDYCALY